MSAVEEGGLGFKDITTLNRALMIKKLCDIIRCDRTSIWVEWYIKAGYVTPVYGRSKNTEVLGVGGKSYNYGLFSALWWTIRSVMGDDFTYGRTLGILLVLL
ncbi:UNVERIFIED_CONTAM: hypothetical protein Sindi_2908500 [Sesamum indicum]